MHIERKRGNFAHGFEHRNAEGKIWHEMAVHNVEVNQFSAGLLYAANFFTQAGEISRKD